MFLFHGAADRRTDDVSVSAFLASANAAFCMLDRG